MAKPEDFPTEDAWLEYQASTLAVIEEVVAHIGEKTIESTYAERISSLESELLDFHAAGDTAIVEWVDQKIDSGEFTDRISMGQDDDFMSKLEREALSIITNAPAMEPEKMKSLLLEEDPYLWTIFPSAGLNGWVYRGRNINPEDLIIACEEETGATIRRGVL